MTRSSILTAWSLLLLSGLPLAASCGASDSNASNDGASSRCDGGDCPAYDASLESGVVHPTHEGGLDAEAAPPRNPLCGSGCLPDDALACSEFSPPTSKHRELLPDASPEEPDTDDMGGDLDAGAEADAAEETDAEPSEGGAEDDGGADAGPDGQSSDAGADSDAGPDGADGGLDAGMDADADASGPAVPVVYACQVLPVGAEVEAACLPSGGGDFDAPCLSGRDCAPGFACVGESHAGLCRPYCCEGQQGCAEGLLCTERQLVVSDPDAGAPVSVPVCTRPDNCDLSQPYPCSEELRAKNECTCREGLACTVIAGGQTSCLPPGAGLAGEACPCAWGHICSQGTQRCLKLCSTVAGASDCTPGRCQGSKDLPEGYGVCVGATMLDGG